MKIKCEELRLKYRKKVWSMKMKLKLTTENKLFIYKQVLEPLWTYCVQLCEGPSKSNKNKIQIFQNKVLRVIADAFWYIRNADLHDGLKVPIIDKKIRNYEQKLHDHAITEALQLLDNCRMTRSPRDWNLLSLCLELLKQSIVLWNAVHLLFQKNKRKEKRQ